MAQWQYKTFSTELNSSVDLMKSFAGFCRITA